MLPARKFTPLFPIPPWHISPLILFWKFCLQSLPLSLPLKHKYALRKKRANVQRATICSWGQEGGTGKNLLFESGMRAEGRSPDPKIPPDWWQNPGWGGERLPVGREGWEQSRFLLTSALLPFYAFCNFPWGGPPSQPGLGGQPLKRQCPTWLTLEWVLPPGLPLHHTSLVKPGKARFQKPQLSESWQIVTTAPVVR